MPNFIDTSQIILIFFSMVVNELLTDIILSPAKIYVLVVIR